MNDNSTDFGQLGSIAEQAPAFEALDLLVSMFPDLPAAYITTYAKSYAGLAAQLNTPAEFEAWRTALQIPTEAVDLHGDSAGGWLAAETTVRGVLLRITGHGLTVTREQAEPQPREHGIPVVTLAEAVALMGALPMPTVGELAEQRHLVDPLDHVLEHLADERTS
ncbi:hypothetical protein [Streptomyces sp. IBSNAI001]|uniref:hypothetical protein n=1 Tax=Streptomyces sp. IBSNAI001 TaxID=3457499 RepID=UPI003FD107F3